MKRLNQQGFTLTEVLIALSIFTVGVLAVATMQTSSIRHNTAARLASEGVFLAERQMETFMAATYAAVPAGPGFQVSGTHTIRWNVVDQDTHKTIAITVTWADANGNRSYALNSIKGNF